MNAKVLLTGATGFLGAYLLRELINRGYAVRALKRSDSDLSLVRSFENKVEWVEADILDITALYSAMNGISEVYHAAAFVSFLNSDKKLMYRINVEGTANIVNCALENGVERILHVSSIAALGRKRGVSMITEESIWDESSLNTHYAVSKQFAEREVWRGMAEGMDAVIINPSVIVGSGRWDSGSGALIKRVASGIPFYTGGKTGFVDVRDVAAICIDLMEKRKMGERYIVSAENLSIGEFFGLIAQALGQRPPFIKMGRFLTEVALVYEFLKSAISGKKRAVTRQNAMVALHDFAYSNQKVVKDTGFSFRQLNETVRDTVAEFKKAGGKNDRTSLLK